MRFAVPDGIHNRAGKHLLLHGNLILGADAGLEIEYPKVISKGNGVYEQDGKRIAPINDTYLLDTDQVNQYNKQILY